MQRNIISAGGHGDFTGSEITEQVLPFSCDHYPVFFPNIVLFITQVGKAMIKAATDDYYAAILEVAHMRNLAASL